MCVHSSPSKSPISLKPYQSCGDARSVSLLEGNIHHTSSRSASPEKHNSDYYVPSEVFVQDKEEQETIDVRASNSQLNHVLNW